MINKKGDIWVSAVIYIALGIIILSIVLAVGIPTIQKMKDNHVAKQTKEIMFKIDENIRSVYNQGPGAQTQLKIKVGKGDLTIEQNKIEWIMRTKALLSEPGATVTEGPMTIITTQSAQEGEYDISLMLDYSDQELELAFDETQNPLRGTKLLTILNEGIDGSATKIKISEL
jgi:type II secretory pathway pseudopilin PulG